MLNKDKIRIMSKLAVYDKKYGAVDRKKSGYFKWDYIYFRNFWTRLGVFSGCLIIALFYALNKILVEQADILLLDLKYEATKIGFFTIAALVLYTIIGTMVSGNEYKRSRERLDAYFMMLDKLDEVCAREKDEQHGQNGYAGAGGAERAARRVKFERSETAGRRTEEELYRAEAQYRRRADAAPERYEPAAAQGADAREEDNGRANRTFKKTGTQKDDLISRLREARERGGHDDY